MERQRQEISKNNIFSFNSSVLFLGCSHYKVKFYMFFVAQRTKRSVFYGAGGFWRLPLLTGQKKIGEKKFSPISNYWDFITCSTSCPIDSTRFSRTAWHKARLCYTRLFAARAIDREFCFICSTKFPIDI